MTSAPRMTLEEGLEHIQKRFEDIFSVTPVDEGAPNPSIERGHIVCQIPRAQLFDFVSALKSDPCLCLNLLLSVTAVDWMDERDDRFEVVYHLLGLGSMLRVRIKIAVPEHKPEVASLVPLFSSANFMEREVWDMYGISFKGHPDLRRILMYEEFKGHPLRKDYPVQGKQPRVALRYPEVENTAREMVRGELVAIRSRKKVS